MIVGFFLMFLSVLTTTIVASLHLRRVDDLNILSRVYR